MKRITRILVCLIITLGTAFSSKAEIRWGASAGITLTDLHFNQDLIGVEKTAGPAAGIQGELMFPGIGFGLDLGAFYSMQGAKLNLSQWPVWNTDGYNNPKYRSYLHTISIPVNLRFKWTRMGGLEEYIAPFVFGGPVFNFTVGHNKLKAMEYTVGAIGVQAGLGFELWKRWQIQGSYVWGLTYTLKAVKLQDFSARERYWTIRATYFF